MKKYLFTFFALLSINGLTAVHADAQSWQWGVRGNDDVPPNPSPSQDNIIDMATDPNGNVYTITKVGQQGDINGQPVSSIADQSSNDLLISSFNCEGQLRWHKVLGSAGPDVGKAIKTDSLGGVYVTANLASSAGSPPYMIYIDSDTSFSVGNNINTTGLKSLILVKYDTSGNFQWERMPEPDTLSVLNLAYGADMDVDGAGNVYLFSALHPGSYANNSFTVATYGVYILKYNKDGVCTGGIPLDITGNNLRYSVGSSHFKMDFARNRYYLAGMYDVYYTPTIDLNFGNTTITHPAYLGCFDGDGNVLWVKQSTHPTYGDGIQARPAIDAQGNIYVTGSTYPSDSWGGYTFLNSLSNSNVPFVIAMDTNGNNLWVTNAATNGGTGSSGISYRNNTIGVVGSFPGILQWDNKQLTNVANQRFDIFFGRFNALTGTLLSLDSIKSNFGYDDFATGITAGTSGNFYISGRMSGQLYVADDTLNIHGAGYDWFLARYGSACGCTPPVAHFSAVVSGTGITFTYDGSQPVDSVLWDFGDGQQGSGNSVSHTYADTGVYSVCVTAANSCGGNTYCQYVNTEHTGIEAIPGFPQLRAYPNPATQTLTIANAPNGMSLDIYNTLGRLMLHTLLQGNKDRINVSQLPPGIYLMRFRGQGGKTGNTKFVKQ